MAKSPFTDVLEIAKKQDGRNRQTIQDLIQIIKNDFKEKSKKGLYFSDKLKKYLDELIARNDDLASFYYDCYWQILVVETPYS